jgi:hypothetical protein
VPIRDTYADRPASCPTCGSPVIEHGIPDFIGDRGPEAVCTISYQAAVTPERLAALEAEHAALLSHIQRGADAPPTLRDYIDWVKAVYQPGPQNTWMALLEAAERVEQLARPDAGEVCDG